ncbi:MAG: hypothetical protein ACYDBJ_02760 [Aggregatilineales bacterium]
MRHADQMRTVFLLILVFLSSCSAGTNAPDGGLSITLKTDPEPAQIGDGKLVVNVLDANRHPLNGADVEISFGQGVRPNGKAAYLNLERR